MIGLINPVRERREEPPDPDVRGFLQLCSDRRYHVKVMEAFEDAADIESDQYYIEARPGGAPSWSDGTRIGRFAYKHGAGFMGWAAHGDRCLGFRGASNEQIRKKLEHIARKRRDDFPRARHFVIFGEGGEVELTPL